MGLPICGIIWKKAENKGVFAKFLSLILLKFLLIMVLTVLKCHKMPNIKVHNNGILF